MKARLVFTLLLPVLICCHSAPLKSSHAALLPVDDQVSNPTFEEAVWNGYSMDLGCRFLMVVSVGENIFYVFMTNESDEPRFIYVPEQAVKSVKVDEVDEFLKKHSDLVRLKGHGYPHTGIAMESATITVADSHGLEQWRRVQAGIRAQMAAQKEESAAPAE